MNSNAKIENDKQLQITKGIIAEFESALNDMSDEAKTVGEDPFRIKLYQDSFLSVLETLKKQVDDYELKN